MPDSDAYSLYTKLCCLSWWAFFTVPNTYQRINKWCMHEQTLDYFNEYFSELYPCIPPPSPTCHCVCHHACPSSAFHWHFPFLLGHQQLELELELEQIFIILYVAMTRPLRLTVRTGSQTLSYMPDQIVCWGVFPGPLNPVTSICRRSKSCLCGLTRWDEKKMFKVHSESFSGLQIHPSFYLLSDLNRSGSPHSHRVNRLGRVTP